jgi:hypothetical protein
MSRAGGESCGLRGGRWVTHGPLVSKERSKHVVQFARVAYQGGTRSGELVTAVPDQDEAAQPGLRNTDRATTKTSRDEVK